MADIFDKCMAYTAAREVISAGIYPYFKPIQENYGSEVVADGKRLIMMASNNYLGLTVHPKVLEASKKAIDKYGSGCTGSRFLNGGSRNSPGMKLHSSSAPDSRPTSVSYRRSSANAMPSS